MRRAAGRTVAAASAVDHSQGNVSEDGAMGVTSDAVAPPVLRLSDLA